MSQKEWASFNRIQYSVYKLCCHRCVAVGSTVVTVGYEGVTEITGDSVDSYTRGEGNSMIFKVTPPDNSVIPSGVFPPGTGGVPPFPLGRVANVGFCSRGQIRSPIVDYGIGLSTISPSLGLRILLLDCGDRFSFIFQLGRHLGKCIFPFLPPE